MIALLGNVKFWTILGGNLPSEKLYFGCKQTKIILDCVDIENQCLHRYICSFAACRRSLPEWLKINGKGANHPLEPLMAHAMSEPINGGVI